jgi:hypothetical protein
MPKVPKIVSSHLSPISACRYSPAFDHRPTLRRLTVVSGRVPVIWVSPNEHAPHYIVTHPPAPCTIFDARKLQDYFCTVKEACSRWQRTVYTKQTLMYSLSRSKALRRRILRCTRSCRMRRPANGKQPQRRVRPNAPQHTLFDEQMSWT